jgi:two-component system, OmpR family, response regulator QseB
MSAMDTQQRPSVLLVEDDAELLGMLETLLTDEGYLVFTARDGQRGLHLGLTRTFDVIVLDRRMPALDGLDLLTRLRRRGVTTPVLVLSALNNPGDRVAGLDAGAEDYLPKPFDIDELLARLRALRRRHLDTARSLPIGRRRLDVDARLVVDATEGDADPEKVRLSQRECELLATLAARPTRVFTRGELLTLVFPDAEAETAVDTYVHYLRRKLGAKVVTTVYGRGYQIGTN